MQGGFSDTPPPETHENDSVKATLFYILLKSLKTIVFQIIVVKDKNYEILYMWYEARRNDSIQSYWLRASHPEQ